MSGRGIERDPRGRRRWAGRGSPPPAREAREAHKTEAKFKGANHELPSLNYGASPKENRPIEFLQLMGEYSARTYKDGIAQAFWTSPPQFGEEEEEPVMPEAIPNTNAGKVIMADFTNDKKEWKLDKKKVTADKKTAFAVTYGQLAEASRSEVQDHEEWAEAFINRDLLFLIERIRSTHIARQSGNPRQDMERVRNLWSSRSMHMQPHESSFAFRKRVEDYQLERVAVGLPEILDEELVIGILNRLDMSRYHSLVKDYLDNERRGIAELPELSSTLWKEIKDTQIIRFRGMAPTNLHGVYVSHADETPEAGRGHGRGRGRYQGRGGRGRGSTGRGRGRGPPDSPAITESIKPSDIICWSCGKKGHRSSACPSKAVHFADSTRDAIVFLTTIADFTSTAEDKYPEQVKTDAIIPVFLSTSTVKNKKLYLDTQSGIHLISNSELLVDISDSVHPITVQGITGDRTRVTAEGTIKSLGTIAYYNPNVAANILSYHKLQETHHVTYDETNDTFIAAPFLVGPILEFPSTDGHYVLDFDTVLQVYITATDQKAAKYTKRQLTTARLAYDFIIRMGFISYKAAAEVVQRGSISDLGFTRADLVNAQDIYGTPAAYQLGQGISTPNKHYTDDPIPMHESVAQELQVDIFFFLGQAFFVSISVLLGLIMVTHLGPASDNIKDSKAARQTIGARAKAGQALLMHIKQYMSKGFVINRVTSDGEASIKATKHDIEALGVELNILGHGSHTPHAEAAIRHIKNKARSTLYSLGYKLPNRLASALIAFVVHTSNMVPKINSVGHQPAHSAFLGRVPNFKRDAPHPFGIAGFLQRTHSPGYNSAAPRGDYCIWLGTTHNLAGTHRCLNLTTLREMTGDTFHPTLLTPEAIRRLNTLAGIVGDSVDQPETPLENPSAPYPLDPYRGVIPDEETLSTEQQGDIIGADTIADTDIQVMDPSEAEEELRTKSLADIVIETRDTTSPDNEVQDLDSYKQVLATLSIKSARKIYGKEISDKATTEELQTCIQKDVWEYLDPMYVTKNAIPSRMFLTPKSLPNGTLDRIKGRIVAGGHKQDRSLYEDSEVSSPTVALTSVIAMAALAAREGHHVMSLDHKAAYLNADMTGTPVEMLLSPEVAEILCGIDIKYEKYVRKDRKIAVRLKKALYGCVQSAVLWYNELTSTLESIGFSRNPYDTCSFTRARDNTFDRILVYVDDLFLTSACKESLETIANILRAKYDAVTYKLGAQHDFLGIHWDFSTPGQANLTMDGYISDIISKFNVIHQCNSPATARLFMTSDNSPLLNSDKQAQFHSCVMTLYYLGKRVRPQILTAVSYLASKVLSPTIEDQKKLDRVLSYLLFSRHNNFILRIGCDCQLHAYVDSSFGVYEDGKSVTGTVIMLGEATIYVKSGKQKIVTRSSTESELVGISDSLSQILWTREYLIAAGLTIGPAIIHQDNQSTIFLAKKGKSTSERSRHIKIRHFFVSHYIEAKEIEVRYLPTEDMIADILTKPLHGLLFATLCAKLTGVFEKSPEHNTDHQPYSSKEQSTLATPCSSTVLRGTLPLLDLPSDQ